MGKEKKTYHIRESELREIIREMIAAEAARNLLSEDHEYLRDPASAGKVIPKPYDYLKGVANMAKGIPNLAIPDSWKEKVANGNGNWGNRGMRWLLDVLGASAAGTAGPDYFKDPGQTGESQDPDAKTPFNVAAAVHWLRANALPRYIKGKSGRCAEKVRTAMNTGGLKAPWGNWKLAGSAKGYLSILPANGWDRIPLTRAGEPGDVCVIDACVDSKGGQHPDGHISMCVGGGRWLSDFVQKDMYGLVGTPPASAVAVFRYRNRV